MRPHRSIPTADIGDLRRHLKHAEQLHDQLTAVKAGRSRGNFSLLWQQFKNSMLALETAYSFINDGDMTQEQRQMMRKLANSDLAYAPNTEVGGTLKTLNRQLRIAVRADISD